MSQIHYYPMLFFILFMFVHFYLVFYHDYIYRLVICSSIIGGWKFIEEPVAKEYEEELAKQEIIKKQKEIIKELKKEPQKEEKATQSN